jgi:hypothetical protein
VVIKKKTGGITQAAGSTTGFHVASKPSKARHVSGCEEGWTVESRRFKAGWMT